jgi:hypothetical protein
MESSSQEMYFPTFSLLSKLLTPENIEKICNPNINQKLRSLALVGRLSSTPKGQIGILYINKLK